jgi:hypothetical protein
MVKKAKLLLLLIATFLVITGLIVEPSTDPPSAARYTISNAGQFLIIFLAVLVGVDGMRFFSLKSTLGKSLLFISLGILSWGLGVLLWLYYNLALKIEVPYPSLGDAFFLGTVPLVAFGLMLLLKSIKIKLDAPTTLKLLLLPAIVLVVTYALFVHSKLAEDVEMLIKVLNVLYPLGDAIFLSFALIILTLTFGGVLFKPLGVLSVGFIVEAIADFSFSYTTTVGTYYVGSWVDILFALAFCIIGVGMYMIHSAHSDFVQQQKGLTSQQSS